MAAASTTSTSLRKLEDGEGFKFGLGGTQTRREAAPAVRRNGPAGGGREVRCVVRVRRPARPGPRGPGACQLVPVAWLLPHWYLPAGTAGGRCGPRVTLTGGPGAHWQASELASGYGRPGRPAALAWPGPAGNFRKWAAVTRTRAQARPAAVIMPVVPAAAGARSLTRIPLRLRLLPVGHRDSDSGCGRGRGGHRDSRPRPQADRGPGPVHRSFPGPWQNAHMHSPCQWSS